MRAAIRDQGTTRVLYMQLPLCVAGLDAPVAFVTLRRACGKGKHQSVSIVKFKFFRTKR